MAFLSQQHGGSKTGGSQSVASLSADSQSAASQSTGNQSAASQSTGSQSGGTQLQDSGTSAKTVIQVRTFLRHDGLNRCQRFSGEKEIK